MSCEYYEKQQRINKIGKQGESIERNEHMLYEYMSCNLFNLLFFCYILFYFLYYIIQFILFIILVKLLFFSP